MPIHCPIELQPISNEEFHRRDYAVMERVFACHNALGRFCDESIYQADLARRLFAAQLGPVHVGPPIQVTWNGFRKIYYPDLIVGQGVVYELKTVAALVGEHTTQLLNYLMLLGLNDGKLINFRPGSVAWRFVSTNLTQEKRRRFVVEDRQFQITSPVCKDLRAWLIDTLNDWGAFLEISLNQEALTWALGGDEKVIQPTQFICENIILGTQRVHLLEPGIAFKLTAVTEHRDSMETHLKRFLAHTSLTALQWINFNHHQIEFITIKK